MDREREEDTLPGVLTCPSTGSVALPTIACICRRRNVQWYGFRRQRFMYNPKSGQQPGAGVTRSRQGPHILRRGESLYVGHRFTASLSLPIVDYGSTIAIGANSGLVFGLLPGADWRWEKYPH